VQVVQQLAHARVLLQQARTQSLHTRVAIEEQLLQGSRAATQVSACLIL
jgi:hypothetical protein